MLRSIRLYGYLGERYGKEHILDVGSIGEAMRALYHINLQKGDNTFLQTVKDGSFGVVNGEDLKGNNLSEKEELIMQFNNDEAFHIVPHIEGSGKSGLQIFVGVVLVAAAFYFGGPVAGWGAFTTGVAMFGAGLIIAGLTPVPEYESREAADQRASFLFSGPLNTTEQGGCVPLIYGGPITVGSLVLGSELDIEDVN